MRQASGESDATIAKQLLAGWEPQWYARLSDAKGQKKNRAEPCKRWGHSVAIADDKMFIYGGAAFNANFQLNETFYQLDLTNWNWTRLTSVTPGVRDSHSCTAFQDKLYMFGGSVNNESLNDLWEFDLKTKSWKQLAVDGEVPAPREGHSACILSNKYLAIYGGWDGNQIFNDCYVLNIAQRTWSKVEGQPDAHPITREGHSCCLLKNSLYFFGGQGSSNGSESKGVDNFFNELYKLEISFEGSQPSFFWTKIEPNGIKPTRRSAHSSCSYADKYLFIIGGEGYPPELGEENLTDREFQEALEKRNSNEEYVCFPKNDVWVYDVDSNTWAKLKVKNESEFEPRFAQTCGVYQNSLILFGGLKDYDNCTNDVYVLSLDGLNPFVPKPVIRNEVRRVEEPIKPEIMEEQKDTRAVKALKTRNDNAKENPVPVIKQDLRPEVRKEQIVLMKSQKSWPLVSSSFSRRIANMISWPLAAFGLLVDNALINKATNLMFNFIEKSERKSSNTKEGLTQNNSKPKGQEINGSAYITVEEDGKGWRYKDFINIIMNYDTDSLESTLHLDAQSEEAVNLTREDRVNEYALNLKVAGFRLGNTLIYITQTEDEVSWAFMTSVKNTNNTNESILHCGWKKSTGEHLTDSSAKSKAAILSRLEGVFTEEELVKGLETYSNKMIILNLFEVFTLKLNDDSKQKNYELVFEAAKPNYGNDIMVRSVDQQVSLLPPSCHVIELSLRTYLRYFLLDHSQVNMKIFINNDTISFAHPKDYFNEQANQQKSMKIEDKGLFDGVVLFPENKQAEESNPQTEELDKQMVSLNEEERNQGILLYFHNRLIRRLENPKLGDLTFLLQSYYDHLNHNQRNKPLLPYCGYIELANFFKPNLFKTEIENPYFANYVYSTIMQKILGPTETSDKRKRDDEENNAEMVMKKIKSN